jgi:hypothetical protein
VAERSGSGSGGRANEGGSSYRSGLAAYLAAYGLSDVPVRLGDGRSPGAPTQMWLESTNEVDDLTCLFSTGARWDIQAKRSCSWGRTLDAVVEQWVRAARAHDLTNRMVVLASGDPSRPVRDLGAAFRRLRESSQEFLGSPNPSVGGRAGLMVGTPPPA